MALVRGTMVTSSVRLREPLGCGGMGSVWLADHLSLEAEVAVKLVAPERLARDPAHLERFKREAAIAATLRSPHAVRIFDHGLMQDGTPYIVMERLEGETLGETLARQGRIGLHKASVVLAQLAGVLDDAHGRGIVHRDIKPENIFLVRTEYEVFAKLLDFGIAKHLDGELSAMTTTGSMIGTPYYMSPEQLLDSRDIDHRADLWSLAVVAYHALTGVRPFQGRTLAALSMAICNGELTPPGALVDEPMEMLDAWFGRALSVTREERFGSAREQARAFADAIGDVLGDGPDRVLAPVVSTEPPSTAHTPADPVSTETAAGEADGPASTLAGTASALRASGSSRRRWVVSVALGGAAVVAFGIGVAVRAEAVAEPLVSLAVPAPTLPDQTEPRPLRTAAPVAAGAGASVDAPERSRKTVNSRAVGPAPRRPQLPTTRPGYCDTDDAFVVDERGHLRPKPECL